MPKPNEEVKEPVKVDGGEPSTPEQPVSSPEVKVEEPIVNPIDNKDVSKLEEQVGNLNIALKKEREEGRQKIEDLTKKLDNSTAVLDRFKNAINPEEEKLQEPAYITKEDLEQSREDIKKELQEEYVENQKIEEYKQEITNLETKWDGKDGKPQYKDQEVLDWQKDNNKTYLSPNDAFMQMKHQEIVDYEVNQKIKKAKPIENVEQPATTPQTHESVEIKPESDMDLRKAVLEAVENADKEM